MNFIKRWLLLRKYNDKNIEDYSGLSINETIELKNEFEKEICLSDKLLDRMNIYANLGYYFSNELNQKIKNHNKLYKTKLANLEKCFDLNKLNCKE